jgi:hypothetical protein
MFSENRSPKTGVDEDSMTQTLCERRKGVACFSLVEADLDPSAQRGI